MYRYANGRQTFYPKPRAQTASDDEDVEGEELGCRTYRPGPGQRRHGPQNLLSDEQRQRLQAFITKFDAVAGMEPALRLVAQDVHTFFPFQACKAMQRLVKRFGSAPAGDPRLRRLADRCAFTMSQADGVSLSRSLWALGRLGLRHEPLLAAAAARVPAVLMECGPITIATVWNALEVLHYEDEHCLDVLAAEVLGRLEECDPPEVAIVLHAAAALNFPAKHGLFQALVPHVREREGTFSLRHLAVCFHAAARVGFRDEALCRLVVSRFAKALGEADALALTSAVYACGLLAYFDEAFFSAVAIYMERALQKGGRGLESQQISNMVYTFGKLGFSPEQTLQAVVQYAVRNLWRFKPQELDNLSYGFALLKFKNERFLACLCQHLTEEGRVQTLDAQSLVSMAYSLALLGYLHHPTCRAIGDHAIPKLPHFRPEEFSILVYSLGVLNFRHHDLLRAVVEESPRVLPQFSTQNISNLLHGLGLVTFDKDDDFVRLLASHLATRLPECSAQDLANPITALMRMCVPHDGLLHAIADFVTKPDSPLPMVGFTSQEIANTVYGFDALQVFDRLLFQQAAEQTLQRLDEFIPQEVANVVWAFAKQSFGSLDWFEQILLRCASYAEVAVPRRPGSHSLEVAWCGEDMEKPLAALWPVRGRLPSYERLERVFRQRFLSRIADFLRSIRPYDGWPAPERYQKDFAAWDLYQVGPLYTEELLTTAAGVQRTGSSPEAEAALLEHYVGPKNEDSLLSRYGERLLLSVLPAARWVSSYVRYRMHFINLPSAPVLQHAGIVEPARPKEDEEADQRRFKAEAWREVVQLPGGVKRAWRPVLLSTFLGNWRHRHTELVALDSLVERALGEVQEGRWPWEEDFWAHLGGEVELYVPHTPCLSCVGAFAQLHRWAPSLRLAVAYQDWREWRERLHAETGWQRRQF